MNPTLYDILGVSPEASRDEIRTAWREAADRFEPGEGGSTKQFRLFNQAAEVLLDPERRKDYDTQLVGEEAPKPDAPGKPAKPEGEPSAADEAKAEQSAVPLTKKPSKTGSSAGSTAGRAGGSTADEDAPAGKGTAAAAGTVPGPPVPGSTGATAAATPVGGGADQAATEPAKTTEPGSAAAGGTSRGGRKPAWQVLAVLGVLAAVAVGFAAYFVTQAERAEAYQDAVDRAPAAAESAASAVLSYDYKSLEADRDAAAKYLSDGYRSKYIDTFDKLVSENATKTKATVEAQVLASSAMAVGEDRDPERVPVLLFVNQTTTNSATTGQPSVALNRVRFDMVEVDGTWLVDEITSY